MTKLRETSLIKIRSFSVATWVTTSSVDEVGTFTGVDVLLLLDEDASEAAVGLQF